MKPPYEVNTAILKLCTAISEKVGAVNASFLVKASPLLRKQNRIKTIHSSLKIEGNTLTLDQITAILDNKLVAGPTKDIREVQNAIAVYDSITSFEPDSSRSFLKAHEMLMLGLVERPGAFRKEEVGIMKGSDLKHVAPPAENVPFLMKDLFEYVKNDEEISLIKSCVFHYEMEFIHPFIDGNGRMGRFWQTVILIERYPIFQFLPFETLISETQDEYYNVLALCDRAGNSTAFIEYMLKIIDRSLGDILSNCRSVNLSQEDRLNHFITLGQHSFTRKDYMNVFKNLSSASASRDLKKGVELGLFLRSGDKRSTNYQISQ